MSAGELHPRIVKLKHHRLRYCASTLQSLHRPAPAPPPPNQPINVVCISDTHNTQPPVPSGDTLLHAGDLSRWGTFTEIQAQITWLSQQPHRYKVVIAGNHDLLLDVNFQEQHPEIWNRAQRAAAIEEDEGKTAQDLEWGDVIYLRDSSVSLDFPGDRKVKIYGSPMTPQHGFSAFQYAPSMDFWTCKVPRDTDILLTHGPPRGHLDGLKKSGCSFLAGEVTRVRSRLVVYGHIHVGYGVEERAYDDVERAYEEIMGAGGGWGRLFQMMCYMIWGRTVPKAWRRKEQRTTFVNAAVVEGWEEHIVKNKAIVITI